MLKIWAFPELTLQNLGFKAFYVFIFSPKTLRICAYFWSAKALCAYWPCAYKNACSCPLFATGLYNMKLIFPQPKLMLFFNQTSNFSQILMAKFKFLMLRICSYSDSVKRIHHWCDGKRHGAFVTSPTSRPSLQQRNSKVSSRVSSFNVIQVTSEIDSITMPNMKRFDHHQYAFKKAQYIYFNLCQ